MNRWIFCLVISLIVACNSTSLDDVKVVHSEQADELVLQKSGDTLKVDLNAPRIYWKGTKMRGTGKHEGVLDLEKGWFLFRNGQLSGGQFVADMNSIRVTDIPEHEPVPGKRLNNHLKSDDFFGVQTYPRSTFKIVHVKEGLNDSLQISGYLTIRDSTRKITFPAHYADSVFTTSFVINRFQWNVAYRGNWTDRTFVDPRFGLKIRLVLN